MIDDVASARIRKVVDRGPALRMTHSLVTGVAAGQEDGRICRVDPAILALDEIVGFPPARVARVIGPGDRRKEVGISGPGRFPKWSPMLSFGHDPGYHEDPDRAWQMIGPASGQVRVGRILRRRAGRVRRG